MSALRDTFLSLQIFLGTDDLESSQGFDEIRSLTIRLRWSLCHLCALGPVMMVDSSLGWILFRVGCESQTGWLTWSKYHFFFQVNVQESANSVHSWSDLARWQTWEDLDFLKCTRWWIFKMHFFCLGSWVHFFSAWDFPRPGTFWTIEDCLIQPILVQQVPLGALAAGQTRKATVFYAVPW